MISVEVFASEFEVLSERFNHKLSGRVLARYHQIISSELSTDEFLESVQISFRDDTFFPSPKVLIDRGKASGLGVQAQTARLLRELDRPALLPESWQQRTGVALVSELDAQQSAEFLNYLKAEAGNVNLLN